MNEMVKTEELEEKTFFLPPFPPQFAYELLRERSRSAAVKPGDSSPGLWLVDGTKLCLCRLKMDASVPPKWYLSTRLQDATFQTTVNIYSYLLFFVTSSKF
jgi:hypothetical protein